MIGKTLAHYKITEKIGAGGMGEVYRATDAKLGRDVALKMLPAAFAQDPERLARFQREARVLASLNHPNIGAIYGLEEHDAAHFLVLELIEGPTLSDRLAGGQLALDEITDVARQIAEAVEFAHENGVVHRDLKPANVKLTTDGRVKVLDFGLAKAMEDPAASAAGSSPDAQTMSPTLSPTLQSPITGSLTGANVILGTAAYMSPEQARGKPLDRRTDIFSFGCLFYEMLSGRRPFTGETISDVIARILEREPDWAAIPASTPERVLRIVRRCLEKDARKRQRDIGDVRVALEEIQEEKTSSSLAGTSVAGGPVAGGPASTSAEVAGTAGAEASGPAAATPTRRSSTLAWSIAGVAVLGGGAAFLLPGLRDTPTPPKTVRFHVTAPPGASMYRSVDHFQLSPDGSAVVWRGANSEGRSRTWYRRLDSLEARELSSAIRGPVSWSPDSRSIAFPTEGSLSTMSIDGNEPHNVCDMVSYRGATWGSDYLVFALGQSHLFRVPIRGGTPEPVTTLNESRGETAHRYPYFLPDGETFLFVALPGKHGVLDVYAGHIDGREPVFVTKSLISPRYSDGHLVFQRGRRFMAQPFDLTTLAVSGEPLVIGPAPRLHEAVGAPTISTSWTGHLTHQTPADLRRKLVWVDPDTGKDLEALSLDPDIYFSPMFSPDGRHVALVRRVSPEESDVWVLELERMILRRFTQGPGNHHSIHWSPDGKWIAYSTDANGPWDIYKKPFPGGGPAVPVVSGPAPFKNLMGWSPDGELMLYSRLGEGTNMDLWIARADGSGEPWPYQAETFQEEGGRISPDGRWVVYESREDGRQNIYVDSFPEPGNRHRVSVDGGVNASWTLDGSAIRFVSFDLTMQQASFRADPEVRIGRPQEMFKLSPQFESGAQDPGTHRILSVQPLSEARETSATVVLNWRRQFENDDR